MRRLGRTREDQIAMMAVRFAVLDAGPKFGITETRAALAVLSYDRYLQVARRHFDVLRPESTSTPNG
jgi:hypothetical protein